MSELKTAQELLATAASTRQNADPELTSVTQLLKSLDRASKNVRTFGHGNSVAQKFFNQFYTELTAHLTQFNTLTFVVQREGLYLKEQLVYNSQSDDAAENFAFKLYSDGIRELTIHPDIAQEDVLFFFDALWNTSGQAGTEDDDIVTRLWTKNLPTLTIVTADEVMKISEIDDILAPQGQAPLEASLREIIAEAKSKEIKEAQEATDKKKPRVTANVTGYDVSELEIAALERDIAAESARNSAAYILDILSAVFSSERSPTLATKLLDIYENVLKSLLEGGHWSMAEQVLSLLVDAEAIRPDLTLEQREQVDRILDRMGSTEIITLIEHHLNKTGSPQIDDLQSVFLMLRPSAIPALWVLLGNLEHPAHLTMLTSLLTEIAKDVPDTLTRHLTDRRPAFVRNLLTIVAQWNNPRLADSIEKIIRYPDPLIRREVIRTLSLLRPSGNAAKIVPLLNDADEAVRLAALKPLLTGQYTAPFPIWEPIVTADTFGDRPPAERRNIFHAMRATAGDEAVPFWTTLLTEWGWTNRKKREELALIAVDALGKLGTPAAQAALHTGTQKGTAAVKQACTTAITNLAKQAQKS
jgi:hypothetical protein